MQRPRNGCFETLINIALNGLRTLTTLLGASGLVRNVFEGFASSVDGAVHLRFSNRSTYTQVHVSTSLSRNSNENDYRLDVE